MTTVAHSLSMATWSFHHAEKRAGLVGNRNFFKNYDKGDAITRKNTQERLFDNSHSRNSFGSGSVRGEDVNKRPPNRRSHHTTQTMQPTKTSATTHEGQKFTYPRKSCKKCVIRATAPNSSGTSTPVTTTTTITATVTAVSTPTSSFRGDPCPTQCGSPQCFCDAEKPLCFVNASGFTCNTLSTVGWHIDNSGLSFINANLNGLNEQCNSFVPPVNDADRQNLIDLLSVTAFGKANRNVSGIWTDPFDFLGDCNSGFFCDTGYTSNVMTDKTQPLKGTCMVKLGLGSACLSVNQCDTQRCVNQSDLSSPTATAAVVEAANGSETTSTFICARLTDKTLPLTELGSNVNTSGTFLSNTAEIALLSIGCVLVAFFIGLLILRIRKCIKAANNNTNNTGRNDETNMYVNNSEKSRCFLERFRGRSHNYKQNQPISTVDGTTTITTISSNNESQTNSSSNDTFTRWNFGRNFVAKHLSALRIGLNNGLANLRFSIRPRSSTNNGEMRFSIVPGGSDSDGTSGDRRVQVNVDDGGVRSSLLTNASDTLSVLLPPPPSFHNRLSRDDMFGNKNNENAQNDHEFSNDTSRYSSIGIYSAGYTSGTSNEGGYDYSTFGELYNNLNINLNGNITTLAPTSQNAHNSYNSGIQSSGIGSANESLVMLSSGSLNDLGFGGNGRSDRSDGSNQGGIYEIEVINEDTGGIDIDDVRSGEQYDIPFRISMNAPSVEGLNDPVFGGNGRSDRSDGSNQGDIYEIAVINEDTGGINIDDVRNDEQYDTQNVPFRISMNAPSVEGLNDPVFGGNGRSDRSDGSNKGGIYEIEVINEDTGGIDIDNVRNDEQYDTQNVPFRISMNAPSLEVIEMTNPNFDRFSKRVSNNSIFIANVGEDYSTENLEDEKYIAQVKLYEGLQLIEELLMDDEFQKQEECERKEYLEQQLQEIKQQEMEAEERQRELEAIKLSENNLRELERLSKIQDDNFTENLTSETRAEESMEGAGVGESRNSRGIGIRNSRASCNSDDSDIHGGMLGESP
ncbi:9174_t:CDS:1 [Acaulospora colombiana]|uniref:9174_t:CDS:1 n=1 Tax=Acaulospora colombiana TaxID=27376 RepID=A0ACA9KNE6_9GLOM|nr:9174_t:CDS:1 [Acaulospora colombiana]